jgi:hypothetical protein
MPIGIPLETIATKFRFILELRDAFTSAPVLPDAVDVSIPKQSKPFTRPERGLWVFQSLPDGAFTIQVRPAPDVPYYLPADVPIVLPTPDPLWPAFPDRSLANTNLNLDDPAQPPAYRTQRLLARLRPTASYPFPLGTTLIRGTVRAGGLPLPDVTVSIPGSTEIPYITGLTGDYVIFIDRPQGDHQNITLRASHLFKPDVDIPAVARRGTTVSVDIDMAP